MLELSHLNIIENDQIILKDVSLKAYPNQLTLVIGESEEGKKILLETLALQRNYETEYLFNQKDIRFHPSIRQHISYVKSSPVLLDELTIHQQLKLMLMLHGKELDHKQYNDYVSLFAMNDKMNRYPRQLNEKERKKASYILSLCSDALIYLLEDLKEDEDSLIFLKELRKKEDIYLIATTNEETFTNYADVCLRIIGTSLELEKEIKIDNKEIVKDKSEIDIKKSSLMISKRYLHRWYFKLPYFMIVCLLVAIISLSFAYNQMSTKAILKQEGRLASYRLFVYKPITPKQDYNKEFYSVLTDAEKEYLYQLEGVNTIYPTFSYPLGYMYDNSNKTIQIYDAQKNIKYSFGKDQLDNLLPSFNVSLYDPEFNYGNQILEEYYMERDGVYISYDLAKDYGIERGDSIDMDIFVPRYTITEDSVQFYLDEGNPTIGGYIDGRYYYKSDNVNNYEEIETNYAIGVYEKHRLWIKGILKSNYMGVDFDDENRVYDTIFVGMDAVDQIEKSYVVYLSTTLMNELIENNKPRIFSENSQSYDYSAYILECSSAYSLESVTNSLDQHGFAYQFDLLDVDIKIRENMQYVKQIQKFGLISCGVLFVIEAIIYLKNRKRYRLLNTFFNLHGVEHSIQNKIMLRSVILNIIAMFIVSLVLLYLLTFMTALYVILNLYITLEAVVLLLVLSMIITYILPEALRRGMNHSKEV